MLTPLTSLPLSPPHTHYNTLRQWKVPNTMEMTTMGLTPAGGGSSLSSGGIAG